MSTHRFISYGSSYTVGDVTPFWSLVTRDVLCFLNWGLFRRGCLKSFKKGRMCSRRRCRILPHQPPLHCQCKSRFSPCQRFRSKSTLLQVSSPRQESSCLIRVLILATTLCLQSQMRVHWFERQPKLATLILSCCHFWCASSVEIGARPRSVNSPPFRARMWNRPSEAFSSMEWPYDLCSEAR